MGNLSITVGQSSGNSGAGSDQSMNCVCICFTVIINLALVIIIQIIADSAVLEIDNSSCDKPIREWLIVWSVTSSTLLVVYVLSLIPLIDLKIRKILACCIFAPGEIFNFAWIIVGSVWEFSSDSCYDEFYNGWALTLAILIIEYAKMAMFCCAWCFSTYLEFKAQNKSSNRDLRNLQNEMNLEVGQIIRAKAELVMAENVLNQL